MGLGIGNKQQVLSPGVVEFDRQWQEFNLREAERTKQSEAVKKKEMNYEKNTSNA